MNPALWQEGLSGVLPGKEHVLTCLYCVAHAAPALPLPAPCSAAYGGPVLDGIVFYQPLEVTDSFKAATERYMQHRFEPKLKVGASYLDMVKCC